MVVHNDETILGPFRLHRLAILRLHVPSLDLLAAFLSPNVLFLTKLHSLHHLRNSGDKSIRAYYILKNNIEKDVPFQGMTEHILQQAEVSAPHLRPPTKQGSGDKRYLSKKLRYVNFYTSAPLVPASRNSWPR